KESDPDLAHRVEVVARPKTPDPVGVARDPGFRKCHELRAAVRGFVDLLDGLRQGRLAVEEDGRRLHDRDAIPAVRHGDPPYRARPNARPSYAPTCPQARRRAPMRPAVASASSPTASAWPGAGNRYEGPWTWTAATTSPLASAIG